MTLRVPIRASSRSVIAPEDPRVQIHSRDPQAEGRFWYSVVTTGVYCRPTCPARRARSENIRIHATLPQARATGFRPCARCRPEEPSLHDRHKALLAEACARLDVVGPSPSTQDLAGFWGSACRISCVCSDGSQGQPRHSTDGAGSVVPGARSVRVRRSPPLNRTSARRRRTTALRPVSRPGPPRAPRPGRRRERDQNADSAP
jgi:Metal binding domain of Ada